MTYDLKAHLTDWLRCLSGLLKTKFSVDPEADDAMLFAPASAEDVAFHLESLLKGEGPEEKPAEVEEAKRLYQKIVERMKALPEAESENLPILLLQKRYSLSEKEMMLLLCAAAPEIDSRFSILYGFLQNDMSQKHASLGFAVEVLSLLWPKRDLLACLDENAPLVGNHLLHLRSVGEHTDAETVLTADLKVVRFLLGDQNALEEESIPFARLVPASVSLPDLVLPPDKRKEVQEVVVWIQNRVRVFESYGFGKRSCFGKGLNFLFYGPSGCGKTLAAQCIAQAVGKPLYRIDFSAVLNQFIGVTEKNVTRIFDGVNFEKILFIDECDGLLAKRASILTSNERYSNMEVCHLLAKLEDHEGIVILATNYLSLLDDAFMRRMNLVVEFSMPQPPEREILWQKVFPAEAPLGKMDFSLLKTLPLSGAQIRNTALFAAFLAAEDNTAIEMKQVVQATRREMERSGKIFPEKEFSFYCSKIS